MARSYFTDAPNVEVVEIPIKDGWTRDWGPSVSVLCPPASPPGDVLRCAALRCAALRCGRASS